MSGQHSYRAATAGERLDVFVAGAVPDMSRAHAHRLIAGGYVLLNGSAAKPAQRLEQGDQVEVTLPAPAPIELEPEAIPLAAVFEDADVIVVDKPPGLTVHPSAGHPAGTLVNALLAHCTDLAGIDGSLRPGIVHRLDKDTSGLLIVAKNDRAQASLSGQIARHELLKAYLALVSGNPPRSGIIDAPIGRHPAQRKRMAVVAEGRPARTHYRVVAVIGEMALLAAVLETGRTHQIRVHLSATGHPLIGDAVYGARSTLVDRQFLHAWRLGFTHPRTDDRIELEAPLPPDLRQALATLLHHDGVTGVDERIESLLQSARAAVKTMATAAVVAPAAGGEPAPARR